jgi:DNA-binding NarL/FixJ family response regulator
MIRFVKGKPKRTVNPLSACVTRRPVSPALVIVASPQARDRDYLRQMLNKKNIVAVEASTYRELLKAIVAYGATLLFCDENLGWRRLLDYLSDVLYPPLVVVVAISPTPHLFGEVLNHGGDYVLSKPFDQSEVERLIDLVISTPRWTLRAAQR